MSLHMNHNFLDVQDHPLAFGGTVARRLTKGLYPRRPQSSTAASSYFLMSTIVATSVVPSEFLLIVTMALSVSPFLA